MHRILRNPLYIYLLGFSLTFIVYSFDWSEIYPDRSGGMKVFFTITFMLSLFAGIAVGKLKLIQSTPARTPLSFIQKGFFFLVMFYAVEFMVEKDIPLLSTIVGRPGVHYLEFGIPLLHGLLISLNSFLIAHSFTCYLSRKDQRFLRYNLLLYLPAVLFLSRSIMVLGALTSLFIYLHYAKEIRTSAFVKLGVLGIIALFLFGTIGNLRSGGDYIYVQSQASDEFMESSIPKEFYWTYLYAASPLANFQNTVNKEIVLDLYFTGYVFYENLPQIISRKLGPVLEIEHRDLRRIVPWLTVGTAYAKSYSYLGWLGPYLLFVSNLLIYLLVILFFVPKRSSFHVTAISILSVIVLLNIFYNMLVVTGISFQLAYCVLFAFLEDKKIVWKS